MYARGLGGCPQDFAKALKLLRTAQAQGSEEASALIERVLRMQREQQAATIPPPPPSPSIIPIGTRVELRGLQAKPELTGRRGRGGGGHRLVGAVPRAAGRRGRGVQPKGRELICCCSCS